MNYHVDARILPITGIILLLGAFACQAKIGLVDNRQAEMRKQETVEARTKLTNEQLTKLLDKEFGGLFAVNDNSISSPYLKGDFNGDRVEDLALAVRLNRQIDPNDNSKPPFQFEKASGPGPSTVGEQNYGGMFTFTLGDLARYRDSSILAVIHGSAERGLTHTEPQQRFVVVDAWHLGKKRMSVFRGKLKPARYGDEPKIIPPPHLLGDAILMIGPEESGTAVYWDGARYRWYEVPASAK